MKILLISESHGARRELLHLLQYEKYDRVIFLGNYCSDLESLPFKHNFPPIVVRGFRDPFHNKPIEIRTKIGEYMFHITNGYNFNVKDDGIKKMIDYARVRDIDCVLFGDDENEFVKLIGSVWFINPGAFGVVHNDKKTYAIMNIDKYGIQTEIKTYNACV